MKEPWSPLSNRLRGRHVVVLAAVPQIEGAAGAAITSPVIEAEEGVLGIVRAVVAEGGRITVIGDSSLALLAAIAAGEYAAPQVEESREPSPPAVTLLVTDQDEDNAPLRRIANLGIVAFNHLPKRVALAESSSRADALVCVGDGTRDDVSAFRLSNSSAPIFVVAASGAGAAALAVSEIPGIIAADLFIERIAPLRPLSRDDAGPVVEPERPLPPVALCAQWIVEQLIERSSEGARETIRFR